MLNVLGKAKKPIEALNIFYAMRVIHFIHISLSVVDAIYFYNYINYFSIVCSKNYPHILTLQLTIVLLSHLGKRDL